MATSGRESPSRFFEFSRVLELSLWTILEFLGLVGVEHSRFGDQNDRFVRYSLEGLVFVVVLIVKLWAAVPVVVWVDGSMDIDTALSKPICLVVLALLVYTTILETGVRTWVKGYAQLFVKRDYPSWHWIARHNDTKNQPAKEAAWLVWLVPICIHGLYIAVIVFQGIQKYL